MVSVQALERFPEDPALRDRLKRYLDYVMGSLADDPLIDVPVRNVIAGGYSEDYDLLFRGRDLVECDPETIKEYVLVRYR